MTNEALPTGSMPALSDDLSPDPADQSVDPPVDPPDQSADPPADPADQSVDPPVDPPDQSADPPADPADQSVDPPVDPPDDGQVCRARGRPRDERATLAITQAALRQLDEMGYAGISMESVAGEAGVARATVYRRYRDKADLVTAAIATNSSTHLAPGPSADPRNDLVAYLTEFDERFAESCLEVVGSLIGAREQPGSLDLHRQRVVAPRMGHALALLERARQLGQLRPDADLDLALQMLAGSVFARRVAGTASSPGWAERAVDTVWSGMGNEGSPADP